nr:HU family DNA-binding protein [Saccharopolyspora hirsuta]
MTKDQLVTEIAEAVDVSKASARAALDALTEIVAGQLESGGEVTLPGFGKFKVADRPARTGRNPATGEAIEIAAKRVVKFVPAKALEDTLNKTS